MVTETITYFDRPGKENTDETLRLAVDTARREGLKTMVLASTTGFTAARAAEMVQDDDIRLVVIPEQDRFAAECEFDLDLIPQLEQQGHQVLFATMLFHTDSLFGNNAPTALANILRTFGQGTKVCLELLLMVADAGLISPEEKVVVVAGTDRGADTAVTATPATTQNFKQLAIHRILCKPLLE